MTTTTNTQISADTQRALQEINAEIISMRDRMSSRWPGVTPLANAALSGEITLADFRRRAFELTCNSSPLQVAAPLELSRKEEANYSISRAILAAGGDIRGNCLEREVSEHLIKTRGLTPRGANAIVIPHEMFGWGQRDQLVGTASLGGNVVASELGANAFIEVLRNRMVTAQAGVRMLPGLVGNQLIPRQTAAAAVAWVGETSASTEASLTFDQVTMTPKTVSTYVDHSWLLLRQATPSIDFLIREDLQASISRGIDSAILNGTGSTQPTGVASLSGIGTVTMGTNGGAPTWASVINLETEVAQDNGDGRSMAYITNAKVRGKMKSVIRGATATDSTFIWENANEQGVGSLNGYRALVTNAARSNLTKGTSTTVCSEIFFGDWSQLLLGMWSGLELLVDPYTQGVNRIVRVHAYQAVDVAARHPEAFSYLSDYTTT